jgi:hypothetical protein
VEAPPYPWLKSDGRRVTDAHVGEEHLISDPTERLVARTRTAIRARGLELEPVGAGVPAAIVLGVGAILETRRQ